jgi:protein-S-isoprenylcysteine O-methyltransferase Ste14
VPDWYRIARRIRVPLGFAFAIFYFWAAQPSWASVGIGSILLALGLIIRAIASGHVRKDEQLTTSGPYAYVRNPLYLGSIVLACGLAVAARNRWVVLALFALFLGIYLPVIFSEERFLRSNFPGFTHYAQHVPRLIPRIRAYDQSAPRDFSPQLYWRHREYNALLGALGALLLLVMKLWISR